MKYLQLRWEGGREGPGSGGFATIAILTLGTSNGIYRGILKLRNLRNKMPLTPDIKSIIGVFTEQLRVNIKEYSFAACCN